MAQAMNINFYDYVWLAVVKRTGPQHVAFGNVVWSSSAPVNMCCYSVTDEEEVRSNSPSSPPGWLVLYERRCTDMQLTAQSSATS